MGIVTHFKAGFETKQTLDELGRHADFDVTFDFNQINSQQTSVTVVTGSATYAHLV